MGGRTAIGRTCVALVLTACTAAACGSSSGARSTVGANPTLATEPAPTTTTNPYALPAVIDTAYVNRVLAGLDAQMGDVVRMVVHTRTISQEALDRMRAVYADQDRLQRSIDGFQRDLRDNLNGYRAEPGNKNTIVIELITANSSCIFSRVQRDYSAVSTNTSALRNPQWVGLRPLDPKRDPIGYNKTNWAFVYDGFPADPSAQPLNPCAA